MRSKPDMRPLICASLVNCVKEVRGKDELRALDAALFLVGPDAPLWFDALGLDVDPLAFVTSGRAGRVRKGLLYG